MNHKDTPEFTVGILALQGDYDAHRKMLEERVGVPTRFVRTPDDLDLVDSLILPGGESTTIAKLMARIGLDTAIKKHAQEGMPLFGTCAGMILMARDIEDRPDQPTLSLLPITVARNAFGRQIDSFETDLPFIIEDEQNTAPVHGVFIRAPYVTQADPDVQVLGRFQDKIVGVRRGPMLAAAFHPELTDDSRIHAYFARLTARHANDRKE